MWRERDAPRWVPLPAHPANSAATTSPRSVSVSQDHEHCENGLDTPPNAVSTHHLSVDGQQTRTRMRTDVKNRENHLERQIDQNANQDNPCECGQPTPPRTSPLPLSCRGMWVYTKRRSRESAKQGRQGYPIVDSHREHETPQEGLPKCVCDTTQHRCFELNASVND